MLWVLPVLIAGDAYDVFPLLAIRNFAQTGLFSMTDALGRFASPSLLATSGVISAADGRMSVILLSFFADYIAWTDLLSWTFVSAGIMAISMLAWWWASYRMFDLKIAWISTVILALMPMYWREALWLDFYNFSFLFLFLSFAAFAEFTPRSRLVGYAASGLLYGLAISSKDAFLVFLPWFVGFYIWTYRSSLQKQILPAALFLVCAFGMYMLPYVGDIAKQGYPANQNLAHLWPGEQTINQDFYLHLYPDPYTYFFDREAYDAKLVEELPQLSLLERIQKYKILLNFNIGNFGPIVVLGNGLWLFANAIPRFFQQELIGGAILWLFILPGVFVLWKKQKQFTIALVGLVASTELLIRFVLHYSRDHLMDYGWVLALFAAVGVVSISGHLSSSMRRMSATTIAVIISLGLSVQLVQANRVWLPRQYARSHVAEVKAVSAEMKTLSEDSVVALGVSSSLSEQIAYLSEATVVPFSVETIEKLNENGSLPDVFEQYGVTHVYGYSEDVNAIIKQNIRSIGVIAQPESQEAVPSTPFLRFILNLIK